MPIQPSIIDQTKYREVKFLGGRILQASELQRLEDLQRDAPSQGKFELGALFDPGASLNARVQIVAQSGGYTVTLLPVDNAKPMMVFVRGAFEAFTAPAMTFYTKAAGLTDQVFVNYIVWRVTPDGAGGTLSDLSLVDGVTGEQTAEMGQIQTVVGADDSGNPDIATMFDRNTLPIPMFTLTWQTGGALNLTHSTGFGSQVQASAQTAGVMKLSTATSQTAVAADDPSVTNARAPLDASVVTSKVKPVVADTPMTVVTFSNQLGAADSTSLSAVKTGSTDGGIGSLALVYEVWKCTVSQAIGLVWSKLVQAYGVLQSFGTRITALENRPQVDLSQHVGRPLGPTVHPAVSGTGFTANNSGYQVVDAAGTHEITGEIDDQGNYRLTRADAVDEMTTAGGKCLKDYRTLAGAVKGILDTPAPGTASSVDGDAVGPFGATVVQKIHGKSLAALPDSSSTNVTDTQMVVYNPSINGYELAEIPSPSEGGFGIAGDVVGAPNAATVVRIQGQPVNAQIPEIGQALVWNGPYTQPHNGPGTSFPYIGGWTPMPIQGLSVSKASVPITYAPTGAVFSWFILQFGNMRIAFGSGMLQHGQAVEVPASDWNSATVAGTWGDDSHVQFNVALSTIQSGGYGVQASMGFQNGRYALAVNAWNGFDSCYYGRAAGGNVLHRDRHRHEPGCLGGNCTPIGSHEHKYPRDLSLLLHAHDAGQVSRHRAGQGDTFHPHGVGGRQQSRADQRPETGRADRVSVPFRGRV